MNKKNLLIFICTIALLSSISNSVDASSLDPLSYDNNYNDSKIEKRAAEEKRWAKFIKKNKLKKITFHELRHTSASIFISSGIDVKNVQRILGHTRADTTLNIYSHIFDSNNDEAAQAIESKLFKNVHPNVHPTSKFEENK